MTYRVLALTLATVTLASPLAFGQQSYPRYSAETSALPRLAPPEAAHRHSSTPYEGARRGEAVWMSGYGEMLLDIRKAALIQQKIEAMQYDNELRKTVTAFQLKQLKADYRESLRQQRVARTRLAKKRARQDQYLMAELPAEDYLSVSMINR